MSHRIIYNNLYGGVSIIAPAEECGLTIEEIASHSVPTGIPYKIVLTSTVPTDKTYREAWTMPQVEMTDGVGGSEGITDQPEWEQDE